MRVCIAALADEMPTQDARKADMPLVGPYRSSKCRCGRYIKD